MAVSEDQIWRIRTKLKELGEQLNPCLSLREVEAFEARYGVALPEEYRAYLLLIGNGDISLFSSLEAAVSGRWADEHMVGYKRGHLERPFPYTSAWLWDDDDWAALGLLDEQGRMTERFEPHFLPAYDGSLCLANQGCGMHLHLIVSGTERGNLWLFHASGIEPAEPKNFLDWYEQSWLDRHLGERGPLVDEMIQTLRQWMAAHNELYGPSSS